jgi:dihydrolipoamide dehydrogenase
MRPRNIASWRRKLILATGSDSIQIPSIPFDGQTIISSKEALCLPQIPTSMLIVGGGVIGCEMACAYAAFGTKVTIVEALERLLPMEDSWVSRLLEREFGELWHRVDHCPQGHVRGEEHLTRQGEPRQRPDR